MVNVHIYAPPYFASRCVLKCRTCRGKKRCVMIMYEWHEPEFLCTGCGDSPHERYLFRKISNARRRKIERVKRLYATATSFSEALSRLKQELLGGTGTASREEATDEA